MGTLLHCALCRLCRAVCSQSPGVSLCRLTSSQLRCRGCTAAGHRNHWRAETSECAALTRVTELPRIAAPVRGNISCLETGSPERDGAQCRKLEIHNVSPNTPSPAAAVQMRRWKIIEVPMVQIIQFNSSASESREHQAGEVAYCAAHSRASEQRCGLTVARGGPQ